MSEGSRAVSRYCRGWAHLRHWGVREMLIFALRNLRSLFCQFSANNEELFLECWPKSWLIFYVNPERPVDVEQILESTHNTTAAILRSTIRPNHCTRTRKLASYYWIYFWRPWSLSKLTQHVSLLKDLINKFLHKIIQFKNLHWMF